MSDARIVVTLSAGTLDGLDRSLDRLGAAWIHKPLLHFETEPFGDALAAAMKQLAQYQAVAITSPRSAALYSAAVRQAATASPAVWTTGSGTARELRGLARVHFVESPAPNGAAAELAEMMVAHGVRGPVLFPCGEDHRDELPSRLRGAGIGVTELPCYRAVIAPEAALRDAAGSGTVMVVGSGRVARALSAAVPPSARPSLVALGPVTARAAAAAGWTPAAVSEAPTIASLLQALHGSLRIFPVVRS